LNQPPLPPCPKCGETALRISVSATEVVKVSCSGEIPEISPPLEGRGWRHRWERIQRDLDELMEPHVGPVDDWLQDARHKLHSFYIQAYHLKDALKDDAARLGLNPQDVEDVINASPALALAADLANLDKHLALNKPPRSGCAPKDLRASAVSVPGGWRLKLTIEHGSKQIDGLDLAKDIVEQWRDALKNWGLI
jgi:hypothetical protein